MMKNDHLESLLLMFIERDILNDVDNDSIFDHVAAKTAHNQLLCLIQFSKESVFSLSFVGQWSELARAGI